MFVLVAVTIVAFWRVSSTLTVGPVTEAFGAGCVMPTTAGDEGREPLANGVADGLGEDPPHAARATITTSGTRAIQATGRRLRGGMERLTW
jgi:hypothetical protein